MAELRVKADQKKSNGATARPTREFVLSTAERQLLRRIGLRIHKDLFEQRIPVERLAFELGLARSTLREIIAGRSNFRILTLNSIAKGLGYKSMVEFLNKV